MFDESRVDWPAEIFATPASKPWYWRMPFVGGGTPECVLSIVHNTTSAMYAGTAFSFMDDIMIGGGAKGLYDITYRCPNAWNKVGGWKEGIMHMPCPESMFK